jgi:hypothetical protein
MSAPAALQLTAMNDDSFGGRLRSERERRRIALEAIAANTKIGLALLQGLERDDVSRWPAGIFRRSFIRSYAEAIGLDGDEIVREFVERFPDRHEPRILVGPGAGRLLGPAGAGRDDSVPARDRDPVLRLTLADPRPPFWGGAILAKLRVRLAAAAWDAGTLLALGLAAFMVFDQFWLPLAIAALGYYAGGIVLLGNTPGVCLFAPRLNSEELSAGLSEDDLFEQLTSEPTVLLNLDRISS